MLKGIITGVVKVLASALGIAERWQKSLERKEAERTGAIKQEHADQKQALEDKDDQLKAAVDRRPGDAERSLRSGDF